jgi:hypothetical protein
LRARVLIFIAIATALFRGVDYGASPDISAADTSALDFKQWGLVAIQDGGRRKPVDTFAGKGLHSYGFGIGGETYVATFIVLDLLFVAFAIWRYRKSKLAVALVGEIEGERVAV